MRDKVLLYLLWRFFEKYKSPLDGRKKIQKLLFLIEHYDPEQRRIKPSTGITGYKFVIWSYGPFSKEIYDDLDKLVENGLVIERVVGSDEEPELDLYIDDGYPKRIYYYEPSKNLIRNSQKLLEVLDRSAIKKIDVILELFGSKKPFELEKFVNNILKLTLDKKIEYWGYDIDSYLKKGGFI